MAWGRGGKGDDVHAHDDVFRAADPRATTANATAFEPFDAFVRRASVPGDPAPGDGFEVGLRALLRSRFRREARTPVEGSCEHVAGDDVPARRSD